MQGGKGIDPQKEGSGWGLGEKGRRKGQRHVVDEPRVWSMGLVSTRERDSERLWSRGGSR